ncbi:MAG: serine/threonine protein kinase [Candidatus Binataceae bacterium]
MITANTIVIGRYRVVKPLGGGGMKMVYLAEDLRLAARPCALAEMVDSFTSPAMQQQAIAAFQREADMLAQLSNEHIPRVFDRFSDQNHHYLVMEYIDGFTLEQKLRDGGGKLGEQEMIEIALQICDTLQYLHNLEPPVIYRDLKPSNVMLATYDQVKLIDFGIARLFQPLSNATMIGTQGYAPPEQYRGKVEFRSDLYALGATMHHALSGRDPAAEPPFSFPPLRSVCPGVTPALADLVDQSLQYDVVLRVADAIEFKSRLLAIKAGVARSPTGPTALPQSRRGSRNAQLGLPLGTPPGGDASAASAPTVLVSREEPIQCPRCGRSIPGDSRFCSFCAAEVAFVLRPDQVAHDARTIDLGDFDAPISLPEEQPYHRHRGGRRRRLNYLVLAALFAGAFILTSLISHVIVQQQPEAPAPDVPSEGLGAPPAARLDELRQELDADGYKNVSFRLDGDTLIVWGTVSTEFDRANIRWLAFRIAGIVSVVDHIQVHDTFAEP